MENNSDLNNQAAQYTLCFNTRCPKAENCLRHHITTVLLGRSGIKKQGKDLIWGEHGDLNAIPGLTDMVTGFLNSIQEKGMLETVKSIL